MNKFFCQINVKLSGELSVQDFEELHYDGVKEVDLCESEVDEILKEKSYSGGSISAEDIEKLESHKNELEFYFYKGDYETHAKRFSSFIKEKFPDASFSEQKLSWDDWNSSWRKHFKKIEVSDSLRVIPSWEKDDYSQEDVGNLFLYPGMGFGTGNHETTFLCLDLFERHLNEIKNFDNCLDFGCGSGILGIAAVKKLNLATTFCDIDTQSLDNCVQNLVLNFEGQDMGHCDVCSREKYQTKKYGLVFANILLDVLKLEHNVLTESLADDGLIIISGLLKEQQEEYLSFVADDFELVESVNKGDWLALLMRKK